MVEIIRVGALELRFLRSKHDTAGGLDMFEMTCPPHARMPVAHHHRDWDETVYGLSGEITWTADGVEFAIGPGDSLFIPRGVVHGFENRGNEAVRCLCVLTPGVLGPEYFREMAAAFVPGQPPDPATMKEIMLRHGLVPAAP